MPQRENLGHRDAELAYSAFHRKVSAARWIGEESAQQIPMINLDHVFWVEYDEAKRTPVALVESALDTGQRDKTVTIMMALAQRANVPAYTVLYKLGDDMDGVTRRRRVVALRVRREFPAAEDRSFHPCTPQQYFEGLYNLRRRGPLQRTGAFETICALLNELSAEQIRSLKFHLDLFF